MSWELIENFVVGILGYPTLSAKPSPTPIERVVRLRFTFRVIFNFDQLALAYLARYGGSQGKTRVVIDVDEAKELSREYSASKAGRTQFSVCLYPPAKFLTQKLFDRAILHPNVSTVIFVAGGTASGKSTAMKVWEKRSREFLIMDGTFSNSKLTARQVWRALASNKRVLVLYIYTPIETAMDYALDRAIKRGRVVPVSTFAETHFNSQQNVKNLKARLSREINFAVRAIDVVKSSPAVGFDSIKLYESLETVKKRSMESFENSIKKREKLGKPVPENIVKEFRRQGRRVG